MNLRVKNNLSVISLINNKLAVLSKENAKKVLVDIMGIYATETSGTDIVATLKTLAYCCGKLENMTEKEGFSIAKFLFEQYQDLSAETVEEADPFTELNDDNAKL